MKPERECLRCKTPIEFHEIPEPSGAPGKLYYGQCSGCLGSIKEWVPPPLLETLTSIRHRLLSLTTSGEKDELCKILAGLSSRIDILEAELHSRMDVLESGK